MDTWELVYQFEEPIVSMVTFRDYVLVATGSRLYRVWHERRSDTARVDDITVKPEGST